MLKKYEKVVINLDKGLNFELILARLGYKKTKTRLDEGYLKKIEGISREALESCKPVGVYRLITKEMFNCLCKESASFNTIMRTDTNIFSCAEYFILMGVTLGVDIDSKIIQFFKEDEYEKGVIFDASASVIVDGIMDSLLNKIQAELSVNGLVVSKKRMSPGHPKIPIELQGIIYKALELGKLNVQINKSLMLSPQKSLIAIAFVEIINE